MNKERYWTFIVYPESVKDNWIQYIESLGIEFAISPLHDKDMLDDLSGYKKAHYHVLVCFNGPTTYNKVKNSICDEIGSTIPKPVLSAKGLILYFTHENNPEKYHYNKEEIQVFNGLDLKRFNDLTISQVLYIKKQIIKYINENNINSYNKLVNIFAYDSSMSDYFQVLSNNTIFFNSYIKSGKEDIIEDRKKTCN